MPEATNGANGTHSALCGVEEFLSESYDYVIVGGGTAGLCVAARLSENPEVKVAVLEAGANRMDDKQISTPSLYPTLIGREKYDWCMTSVAQPTAGNKKYSMPRGKVLGGSSAINYLMYVRGSKEDYNSWASLGGDEWGWDNFAPYFRKHQTLDPPETQHPDPQFMPFAAKDKYHGTEGPIHTSFNDFYCSFEEDFVKAAYEVGGKEKTLHDAWSGDHMGFYSSLAAVNRTTDPGKRSYAATGYLKPNLGRPNLKVLTEAHALKVTLSGTRATGVEFQHAGKTHHVAASYEVILSAGVIQSPQLLELSGIGDPEILSAAGIECKIENKCVGANFQDHVLGGMLYDLADGVESMDALHGAEYAKAAQELYEKENKGIYGSPGMLMGFVSYADLVSKSELEQTVQEARQHSKAVTPFEKKQEGLLVEQLVSDKFANLQTFCIPCQLDVSAGHDQVEFFSAPPAGQNRVSLLICLEHPFSRGSVHIISSDPLAAPKIDPGYFRNPIDVKVLAAGLKWLDSVAKHPAFAKNIKNRVLPPQEAKIDTEEERMEYVRNHISTQYHLIGTCALGEVVDERLKVKGVEGLRVVDASIFPSHVSGNIMASTYAVGEKGSDLIKADDGRYGLARVDSMTSAKKS